MGAMEQGLLGFGYATSIAVLTRFAPVVRQRRWRWLLVHHVGVLSLVAGWALRRQTGAAAVNSLWLVVSTAWYALGGRAVGDAGRPVGDAGRRVSDDR